MPILLQNVLLIVHCVTVFPAAFRSFQETGSFQDLSAEEKACLQFLEETISSLEESGLSTPDPECLPEFSHIIAKTHHIDQMRNSLLPTPLVLAASNGNIPLKQEMPFPKEKPSPNNSNSQPSSGDVSHWGPLSHDGLVEPHKSMSMIKNSVKKQPSTHGDQTYLQKVLENCCCKPNPPAVAPKPKNIPSHIGNLNRKGTTIPIPDSNLHCLSTSPNNYGLIRPDQVKLKALSKLGLVKAEATPENKQDLDAPSSSSIPAWTQKEHLETSGMKLESSESNDEHSALKNLSHTLSLSLPRAPDIDEDRRWALRKLGLLKD